MSDFRMSSILQVGNSMTSYTIGEITKLEDKIAEQEKTLKAAKEAFDKICVSVIYDETRTFGERMGDINEVAKAARSLITGKP